MKQWFWLGPLALVMAVVVAMTSLAQTQEQKSTKPSPNTLSFEQRRNVSRILAHYRQAGKDLEKRNVAVREAIAAGLPATAALMNVITREMAPELKRYGMKFTQEASRMAKERVNKTDFQEVAQLRKTVLDLQKQPDFTHDTIVAQADPAMKRLEELLVINSSDVLKRSERLQEERKQLAPLGSLWEACAIVLYNQATDMANRPKELPSYEHYLQGEEELAVRATAPMDATTRAILDANARLVSQIDPEEARCILAMNLTRNLLGLSALVIDLRLCAAARDHSKDMKERGFFAHESPVEGKRTPWDRAKRFGASASGENIYAGSTNGNEANSAWFHSPGHHKNMLGGHKRIGVGRHDDRFTQMFGG